MSMVRKVSGNCAVFGCGSIENQNKYKRVCAFLDVDGGFNRTSRQAIQRGAEKHGISRSTID